MSSSQSAAAWLSQLQHDLVKRLLWPARDCQQFCRAPANGELMPQLFDDEGTETGALALWARFRETAPACLNLEEFEEALRQSLAAAERNSLEGVLSLEGAFTRLCDQCR